MEYRSYVSLNIAIIGNTKMSHALSGAFTNVGHRVFMANTEREMVGSSSMSGNNNHIQYCSIEDAAAAADFIMICTPASDVREVAYWLGDVRRKVIIDLTVNVPNGNTTNINTVGAINAITGSEHIVKLLSLYNHEQLFKPLFGGKPAQVVLAGDSRKAKEMAKIICKELEIDKFHDFGGTENIALFDELSKCCRSMIKVNYAQKQTATASKR